jgi:hypothetical protein
MHMQRCAYFTWANISGTAQMILWALGQDKNEQCVKYGKNLKPEGAKSEFQCRRLRLSYIFSFLQKLFLPQSRPL